MTKEENEKRLEYLRGIVRRLPDLPGSYQFYDEKHIIIYVGKAKDLHKRLSSYFNRTQTGKTAALVKEIADFKYIITSSEDEGIQGIIRKFTDIYISIFQLEKNYTKEQIIEFYVNNHELIGNIGGIQEGSKFLFNKDAKDLTLPEAALVAGLGAVVGFGAVVVVVGLGAVDVVGAGLGNDGFGPDDVVGFVDAPPTGAPPPPVFFI